VNQNCLLLTFYCLWKCV